MEERVELLNGIAGLLALKLALGGGEIERHELDAAASFHSAVLLPHVGDEPIEARPQIGAEPRPAGIEAREIGLLVRSQKERLGQVGRFVRRGAPFESYVLEHRFPVRGRKRIERRAADVGVLASERPNDGVASDGKPGRTGRHRRRAIVIGKTM